MQSDIFATWYISVIRCNSLVQVRLNLFISLDVGTQAATYNQWNSLKDMDLRCGTLGPGSYHRQHRV